MFTLFLVDTATGQLNYGVINIRGSDLNTGQVTCSSNFSLTTKKIVGLIPTKSPNKQYTALKETLAEKMVMTDHNFRNDQ